MAEVIFTRKTAPTGRLLSNTLICNHVGPITVNWTGAPLHLDVEEGYPVLNQRARTDKLYQLEVLRGAGVLVPDFHPADPYWPNIPPFPGWIGRTITHARAGDFRRRPAPDYWVEPLILTEEKRLHVFKRPKGTLVVIRTAVKVPKEGEESHPWVRSHTTGWRFSYGGGSRPVERAAAIHAVDALGLDFGAVDLGIFCGQPVVLEVNTCPGLDNGQTLSLYAREIARHAEAKEA